MKYSNSSFIIILAIILLLSSCSNEEIKSSEIQQKNVESLPPNEQFKDSGDFKIIYSPTDNSYYNELKQNFKERKLFEEIATSLNNQLILPSDIEVVFSECKEENAFYNPETSQIQMCYELIENIAQLFSPMIESDEEFDKALLDTTFFIFYHEMGHALVDVLNIPVTGREEDSVDQLATIVLSNAGDEGEDAAIEGASWFMLKGQQTDLDELAFADEHSLDKQRFYNIACWIYGKNPERNSYLVTDGYLPEQRAVRCPYEYQQISNSWNRLLEPYIKE